MDIWLYFDVTHTLHTYCNPVNSGTIQELEQLLELTPQTHVLDIACGMGEMLVGFAERRGISGVGVDVSPYAIRRAEDKRVERVPHAKLRFVHERGEAYQPDTGEAFDVAMCVGASWIWSGFEGTLRALMGFAKPGGLIISGEPYWRKQPTPAYLESEKLEESEFFDLASCDKLARSLGLETLWMRQSSEQDWDRYEMLQLAGVDRFARAQPDHPNLAEIRLRVQKSNKAYLRWGREEIGFAFWVFRMSAQSRHRPAVG